MPDEALAKLRPRERQVVECRFFGGMEEQEIAVALGVSGVDPAIIEGGTFRRRPTWGATRSAR